LGFHCLAQALLGFSAADLDDIWAPLVGSLTAPKSVRANWAYGQVAGQNHGKNGMRPAARLARIFHRHLLYAVLDLSNGI
jgi:hypothetical protein